MDFPPLHPPDAVQAVAFEELQVNTPALPAATTLALAVSTAVGITFTVLLAGMLAPPAPLQIIEYVVLVASAGMVCTPFNALVPLQPPDASHVVAFVDVQVSTMALPAVTVCALALSVVVGTTLTTRLAVVPVPPAPVQVIVYVALDDKGPVLRAPLVAKAPLQPPDPVHAVALVDVHVNVELALLATVVGAALMDTVGGGAATGLSLPPQDASNSTPTAGHRK